MYPSNVGAENLTSGVTDDEMSAFTETDTSLQNSTTLPTMDDESQVSGSTENGTENTTNDNAASSFNSTGRIEIMMQNLRVCH